MISHYHNKKHKSIHRSSKRGFFIAELIVAIFIFGIVMTVSIGALVTALDSNKKTQSLKSVLNNLNVVLDTMSKTLTVGTNYYCGAVLPLPLPFDLNQDCPDGSNEDNGNSLHFSFNEDLGNNGEADDAITYMFVPGALGASGYIARTIHSDIGVTEPIRMTAPEVNITDMKFFVTGTTPTSSSNPNFEQPKVLIVVKGLSPSGPRALPTEFMVQTLVSQRVPDF